MRFGKRYSRDAVEKGGDANVAERKLTERQRTFCRLCAEGVKPIEAVKELGYRDVYGTAGKMLRNERIQREIARMKEREEKPTAQKAEEETAAAEKEEILSFLTGVMRDNEEADLKTRMKAAELLGKRESLFEKGKGSEEGCCVVIVDDIP